MVVKARTTFYRQQIRDRKTRRETYKNRARLMMQSACMATLLLTLAVPAVAARSIELDRVDENERLISKFSEIF